MDVGGALCTSSCARSHGGVCAGEPSEGSAGANQLEKVLGSRKGAGRGKSKTAGRGKSRSTSRSRSRSNSNSTSTGQVGREHATRWTNLDA